VSVNREKNRDIRHAAYSDNCRDFLGVIKPGFELFGLTNGRFSLINLIEELLKDTGAANLDVATYSIGPHEIEFLGALKKRGLALNIRLLLDRGLPTRNPQYFSKLISTLGEESVRIARAHCKFVTIRNEAWDIAIRTSMNLNENTRVESLDISDSKKLARYLTKSVDSFFEKDIDYKGPLLDAPQPDKSDLITCAEFARLCGVSRAAIQKAVENGRLDVKKKGGKWKVKPSGLKSTAYFQQQFAKQNDIGATAVNEVDFDKLDIRLLSKADIDKYGALEKAKKTRDERRAKRQELIERKLVQTVFGKLYSIDKNEFLTLGDKLAPDIATLAGVNDPAVILQINERIEEECYKILAHIKRVMSSELMEDEGV